MNQVRLYAVNVLVFVGALFLVGCGGRGGTVKLSQTVIFIAAALLPLCIWASADISINSPSVAEGNSGTTPLLFTVTRSGDTSSQVVLQFQTDDNTATAPLDYVSLPAGTSLTMPVGATSATINVSINGDTSLEGDENFFLHLTSASAVGPGPSFAAASNFTVGGFPRSVTAVDVNGDGRPDLAAANVSTSNVSVLLNTTAQGASTSSYAAASNFAVGANPNEVTAVDVNGDGRSDLATANGSDGVSVLLNTTAAGASAPSFAAASNFTAGSSPVSVTAADVNGDGRLDLVATNASSNNVSVLLNTTAAGASTPSFAATSNFAVGTTPRSVITMDVNTDGRPDVVTANNGSDNVSVLLNTTATGASTASFATASNFAVGSTPKGVAIQDLNGDGRPDLAVANQLSANVSVLLNITAPGASTSSFAAVSNFAVGSQPNSVTAVDVNGDGRPDLSTANSSSGNVSVLLNATAPGATTASFAAASNFAVAAGINSVTAVDVNGDARPDLAVARDGGNNVSVLLNTTAPGTSTTSFAVTNTFTVGSLPFSITATDINGDGRSDLAVANYSSNYVSALLNTTAPGADTPSYAVASNFVAGTNPLAVTATDVNGDGRPDLAVANRGSNNVSVLLNTTAPGADTPSYAAANSFIVGTAPVSLTAADFNGDGRPDLAVANENSANVSVLLNTTAPGASTPSYAAASDFTPNSGFPRSVTAVDVNNDGRPDLAVAYDSNNSSNDVSVLLNTTAPGASPTTFATPSNFTVVGYNPRLVIATDVNGDGRPDLVVAIYGGYVSVLLNTTAPGASTASYAAASNFLAGSDARSVVAVDANNDGRPDLVVTNDDTNTTSDIVAVLLNTTAPGAITPSYAPASNFTVGSYPNSVTATDANGDGRTDLAVANQDSANVSVLLNGLLFTARLVVSEGQGTILNDDVSDTTPDAFNFMDQTNVATNTVVTSNTITVVGINAAAAISVSGGSYNVNGGAFTTTSGTVSSGDTVQARHTSSGTSNTATNTTVTIGGVSDTFTSTTTPDTTPDVFTFADQTNVPRSSVRTSTAITVSGVDVAVPISVAGGTGSAYSIGCTASFTSASGNISNGQTVCVHHTSSSNFTTATDTTLTIGGVSDTFTSTTEAQDIQPDQFTFTDTTNAPLNSVQTSNTVTISGINDAAPISVSGGGYSIGCTGAFTSISGSITSGQIVCVSHNAAATDNTMTSTTLSIGGVLDTFTSTTGDATPAALLFTAQNGVARSATVTSNTITISGMTVSSSISVSGGEYSVNGAAFSTAAGSVSNGQTVAVRHTSAAGFSSTTTTTLTIGGVAGTFTSTTVAQDTTPNTFTFTDQGGANPSTTMTSNSITVSGINDAAPISVTGGTYSINGGVFTTTAGTINSGDTVRVQHTSSSSFSTAVNTALTIGGVSNTFTSTTVAEDTIPTAFSFTDQTGAALNSAITSNAITVSGINSPASISVSGGIYSIDSGAFTAVAGTVSNGQSVRVQLTSSSSNSTAVTATLTIGGVSDAFSVTTVAAPSGGGGGGGGGALNLLMLVIMAGVGALRARRAGSSA